MIEFTDTSQPLIIPKTNENENKLHETKPKRHHYEPALDTDLDKLTKITLLNETLIDPPLYT
ncbi:MAG: hypothetical protein LBR15_03815, partial [Methanobrevibacter sp.]|nr:hypothetical protein [Candidatus Methanovirga australis]